VARHVPADFWQQIVSGLREEFRAGRFEAGLMRAIDSIEVLLVEHHAHAGDAANPNELPNRPHLI
jgi:uncharacterized membrane protein